jgi:glycosyltransferase involved in cell wall biosynthesis
MRILFVLPEFPFPPVSGGRVKVFNILRYLAPRHDCDVFCLGVADQTTLDGFKIAIPDIGSVEFFPHERVARNIFFVVAGILLRSAPPSITRCANRALARRLSELAATSRYDLIHYDIVNMVQYHQDRVASVHSPNDATSLVYARHSQASTSLFKRIRFSLLSKLLRRYEDRRYAAFTKVHVVSEADRSYLQVRTPTADISVIPISSGYTSELPTARNATREYEPPASSLTIAICGNLSDPSIARGFDRILTGVLPGIIARFPDIRVRVLGRVGLSRVQERMRSFPCIEYNDRVDSFEAFVAQAEVILVPDETGAPGPKTRVVQAMALGKTVLGSVNAFEGIPIQDGVHGKVYRSFEECLSGLTQLLSCQKTRRNLGMSAAKLAAREYALDIVGPKYEELYRQATEKFHKRSPPMLSG